MGDSLHRFLYHIVGGYTFMKTAIFHPAFMVREWSGLRTPLDVPRCLCAKSTPVSPPLPQLLFFILTPPTLPWSPSWKWKNAYLDPSLY